MEGVPTDLIQRVAWKCPGLPGRPEWLCDHLGEPWNLKVPAAQTLHDSEGLMRGGAGDMDAEGWGLCEC